MISPMGGGKPQALHSRMRGHDREPIPPAFRPITRAPKLRPSVIDLVRIALGRLRSLGVKVAVDVGTGYSSLARLQRLPVDIIKLDRAFVTDVDVRAEARGMATAILQLSAAVGATTIAQGIETEAEAATLLDLGYTAGQGYLFAQPMPLDDLTARLHAEAAT